MNNFGKNIAVWVVISLVLVAIFNVFQGGASKTQGNVIAYSDFLTRVNAIKQTTSTVFAQVDSGFNHLIRPMLYGSHHEIINISNPKGKERFYTVVGYICETDTFGNNRKISEISEGDILAFKNSGAYCFTMASNYNSRYRPSEILFYKENVYIIRKEETLEDLVQNQILIDFSNKVSVN